MDFLTRNFDEEAPRRAAAKNAFALLGQHKWVCTRPFWDPAQGVPRVPLVAYVTRQGRLAMLLLLLLLMMMMILMMMMMMVMMILM